MFIDVGTLGSVRIRTSEPHHWEASDGREQKAMRDQRKQAHRRAQQAQEVEASQKELRESIAVTSRLVEESDKMLRRHRKECEDDHADC